MKKKIALLLAAVMAVAVAVPSQLFAATTNSVSTVNYAAPNKTIFPDPSLNLAIGSTGAETSKIPGETAPDYVGSGSNLVLKFDEAPTKDGYFRLQLENAEFAFMKSGTDIDPNFEAITRLNTLLATLDTLATGLTDSGYGTVTVAATQPQYDAIKAAVLAVHAEFDGTYNATANTVTVATGTTITAELTAIKALLSGAAATAVQTVIDGISTALTAINTNTTYFAASGKYADLATYNAIGSGTEPAGINAAVGAVFAEVNKAGSLTADKIELAIAAVPAVANPLFSTYNVLNLQPVTAYPTEGLDYVTELGRTVTTPATTIPAGQKWLRLETTPSFVTASTVPYTISIINGNATVADIHYKAGAKREIIIPIVAKSTADEDCKIQVLDTTNSEVSPGTYTFNLYGGGVTSTTVASVAEGRDKISLKNIIISEKRIGVIKDNGWIKLTAPDDYRIGGIFASASSLEPTFKVTTNTGTLTMDTTTVFYAAELGTSSSYQSAVYIKLNGYTASKNITSSIVIAGLTLTPRDLDEVPFGDISLTIAPVADDFKVATVYNKSSITSAGESGDAANNWTQFRKGTVGSGEVGFVDSKVTKETFKAAKRVDFGVTVTAGDAKSFYSGFRNKEAAKVTVKETIANAWIMERETVFSLVDVNGDPIDAKFSKLRFSSKTNVGGNVATDTDYAFASTDGRVEIGAAEVYFKDNTVSLRGFTQDTDSAGKKKAASFDMVPYISVAAGYTGDVYILPNVKGVDSEYEPILIAKVTPAVEIATKSTNVQVGYSVYPIADITITEAAAAALAKNETLMLSVVSSAYDDSDISFNNITSANNLVVDEASGLVLKVDSNKGESLVFTVTTESKSPATIQLKGLALYINRSVPYGDYYLLVGGTAVTNNYSDKVAKERLDKFDIEGVYVEKYVVVATEGINPGATKNVKITENSNIAIINGEEVELPVPTVLKDGSFLVPLRFITIALGIAEKDIHWDPVAGTATIITASRNVIFQEGSAIMKLDGAPINMVDAENNLVMAQIIGDRMYVPFRKLAEAFGVEVSWDPETGVAEYNPE